MLRSRSSRHQNRPGAAAVELAVLLPFLLFLTAIGTDWARLLYFSASLEGVARSGALYASDPIAADKSPYTSVEAAALADAPDLTATTTVTSTESTNGAGARSVTVTASMTFTTITNLPGVPESQPIVRVVRMRVAPTATR